MEKHLVACYSMRLNISMYAHQKIYMENLLSKGIGLCALVSYISHVQLFKEAVGTKI